MILPIYRTGEVVSRIIDHGEWPLGPGLQPNVDQYPGTGHGADILRKCWMTCDDARGTHCHDHPFLHRLSFFVVCRGKVGGSKVEAAGTVAAR